jgi:hypothetical protein
MKSLTLLAIVASLLLTLAGCAPNHPTDAEKQDVLDGMAFAQDGMSITGHMAETYSDFINKGEFLRRSKFFKAGADYRVLKLMDQVNQNVNDPSMSADNDMKEDSRKMASLSWDTLHLDLSTLGIPVEKFSLVVGDDKLNALMASNPYQQ